jgi:hypothetical protein
MHSDDAATTAAQASSPRSSDDADNSARVQGQFYTTYLANLHETLRPATYLEIGTFAGDTLRLANCATIAVDPHFQVGVDVVGQKPMCLLFQQTSDRFFSNHSPRKLFGDAVDMAFLDGLTTRLSLFAAGSHAASVPTSRLSGDGRAKVSGA